MSDVRAADDGVLNELALDLEHIFESPWTPPARPCCDHLLPPERDAASMRTKRVGPAHRRSAPRGSSQTVRAESGRTLLATVLGKLVLSSCIAALFVACAADRPGQPVGVNDVRKACEIRATWARRTTQGCGDCLLYASTPYCACFGKDYSGKCSDHAAAKHRESTCSDADACVNRCPLSDCACVDACYVSAAACRPHAAALEGCLVEVCAEHCR